MQEESSLKFADRLKSAMADSGLKAVRLAAGAGISKGYMSELLKGHKEAPSFEVVKKFADVLGCSPRWLLTGHEPEGIGKLEEPPPSASSSAASAPLRLSSSADPELLAVLARMADALEAVQRGTAKSEGMLGKIVAAQERIATALERLADQPKDNL